MKVRHADLLFQASLHGHPVLLYLLLEHKSAADRWTPLQLLRYVVRVFDRFLQQHPEATFLPPIVPIVVHHGERSWSTPRTLLDLVDLTGLPPAVQKVLSPLQPDLHFLLDDLAATPESQLRARRATLLARLTLLMLQFVRPATERDPVDFVRRWHDMLRALWDDPVARTTLLGLFSYLASQLEASRTQLRVAAALIHEDAQAMGKTIADQFREEGFAKGVAKGAAAGKAEGKAEGRAELLLRLVRTRFGSVPADVESRLRRADSDTLDRWAERLFTASSLADVFA